MSRKPDKNQTTALVYYLACVTFSGSYLGCFILLVPDKPDHWNIFQGSSRLSFSKSPKVSLSNLAPAKKFKITFSMTPTQLLSSLKDSKILTCFRFNH